MQTSTSSHFSWTTLKIETAQQDPPKIPEAIYQLTRCHVVTDLNLQDHCAKFKSCVLLVTCYTITIPGTMYFSHCDSFMMSTLTA